MDTRCRELFYRILIWLWDNFEAKADHADFARKIEGTLLAGLADKSPDIRNALYKFWDNNNRVARDPSQRLLACVTHLYHPEAEAHWLQYCTFLLLNPSRASADFHRPLSDTPLADCKFVEFEVDASWQPRSTPMAPLFAAGGGLSQNEDFSALSQRVDIDVDMKESKSRKRTHAMAVAPVGALLATQAPRFDPTLPGTFSSSSSFASYDSPSFMTFDPDNLFKLHWSQTVSASNSLVKLGQRNQMSLEQRRKRRRELRKAAGPPMGSFAEFDNFNRFSRRFGKKADEASKVSFLLLAEALTRNIFAKSSTAMLG
jgi:hypothetical protein